MIKKLGLIVAMLFCAVSIKAEEIQDFEELSDLVVAQQIQCLDDEQLQNLEDKEQVEQKFFKKHKKKIIAALVAGAVVAGGVFYLTNVNIKGREWCKKKMPWIVWDKERECRDAARMDLLANNRNRTQAEHLELYNLFQKYGDSVIDTMFHYNNNFKHYVKNRNAGLRQDAGILPKKLIEQNGRIYDLADAENGSLGHNRTQEENKELYKLLFESGREGDLVEDLFDGDDDKEFREYLKSPAGLKKDAGLEC